jgi:hypothetical protein
LITDHPITQILFWIGNDFILKDSLRKLTLNAVAKKIGIEVQVL